MPQPFLFRLRPGAARLAALAFCLGLAALLALAAGPAHGQAATTPTLGETTPLGPASRAAGEGGGPDAGTATDGGGGGLVRTIVGLLIVIAVIYGVAWVLKQFKTSKEGEASGFGLETTASLPLGAGRAVHLVRAGNEYLLLGVTDGGVQPLRSYSEEEARAAGFPVDDVDALVPLKETGSADAPGTFVERIRDLTVRR